jgi:peptide deformylase
MQASELSGRVEWARVLPGLTLPPGWQRPSVSLLEAYRQGLRDGYAAPHDPLLHRRMPEIPLDNLRSAATRGAVDALKRRIGEELERSGGAVAGLSANQIRVPARIAAFALGMAAHDSTDHSMTYLANPQIRPILDPATGVCPVVTLPHGCVKSCLDVWANITDFAHVTLSGWDVTGGRPQFLEVELEGYAGAIAAHERRHLDGFDSPGYALELNGLEARPHDPDTVLNWRPVELRDPFRTSFDEDAATASWPLKVPASMARAINEGSYLSYFL